MGRVEGEPELDEENSSYKWLTKEEIKNQEGLDQYFKEVFERFN